MTAYLPKKHSIDGIQALGSKLLCKRQLLSHGKKMGSGSVDREIENSKLRENSAKASEQ